MIIMGTNIMRLYGFTAIIGGVLGIAYGIGFPNVDWGPPGTAAYEAYQNYNRWETLPLLMQLGTLICFVQYYRQQIGRIRYLGLSIFVIGYVLWIAGIVGEFWVFATEPYGSSLRDNSYALTGVGFFIAQFGFLLIGIIFWRSRFTPLWLNAFLILMPILLVTALIGVFVVELEGLDPITVQSGIQGFIWTVLGVFMFRLNPQNEKSTIGHG